MAIRVRYGIQPEWSIDLGQLANGDQSTFDELFGAYCTLKRLARPERVNVKVTTPEYSEGRTMNVSDAIPSNAEVVEFVGVAERKG